MQLIMARKLKLFGHFFRMDDKVAGQLADKQNRGKPIRGLVNSRTGQLVDWRVRGQVNSRIIGLNRGYGGELAHWSTGRLDNVWWGVVWVGRTGNGQGRVGLSSYW